MSNPDQGAAAWLFWIDGLTASEVASRLEANLGTVESRLRAARVHLSRLFAPEPTP